MNATAMNPFLTGLLAALLQRPVANQSSDRYLRDILRREAVFTGLLSPYAQASTVLTPIIWRWGWPYVTSVSPSGSIAKGTANRTDCDLDILISLSSSCTLSLADICTKLRNALWESKLPASLQNASVKTRVGDLEVDLVPARQHFLSGDHSIYNKRKDSWRKTNVQKHVQMVSSSGCLEEIRLIKLWRNQWNLDFPSVFLELAVIRGLAPHWYGTISNRFLAILDFLSSDILTLKIVDPANPSNDISDDLTVTEKAKIRDAARQSLQRNWAGIVH